MSHIHYGDLALLMVTHNSTGTFNLYKTHTHINIYIYIYIYIYNKLSFCRGVIMTHAHCYFPSTYSLYFSNSLGVRYDDCCVLFVKCCFGLKPCITDYNVSCYILIIRCFSASTRTSQTTLPHSVIKFSNRHKCT